MWEHNSFLTLTYNAEYLPKTGSLERDALSLFIRRTRAHFMRSDFRYFGCGEYGENFGRPHYHTLLLGLDFQDKQFWKFNESGEEKLYISKTLQQLWPYGHSYIGSVTFKSAAYVARYCTKKVGGEAATEHYKKANTQTGEIYDIEPEFMRCSLKPAIGKKWFDKYKSDLDKGFITFEGVRTKTPRYYDKLYAKADEYRSVMQKAERSLQHDDLHPDFTLDRLRDKEACKIYAIKTLKRTEK